MSIDAGFWHSVRWWMNLHSKGKFIMSNFQVFSPLVSVHRAEIIMTSIWVGKLKMPASGDWMFLSVQQMNWFNKLLKKMWPVLDQVCKISKTSSQKTGLVAIILRMCRFCFPKGKITRWLENRLPKLTIITL
jgi:hypothetical protein